MKIPSLFLVAILALQCTSDKDTKLYVDNQEYPNLSTDIELPGLICVQDGKCRDYVARWKDAQAAESNFRAECQEGSLLENKACVRNKVGCITTESTETVGGGYLMIHLHWQTAEASCGERIRPDLSSF